MSDAPPPAQTDIAPENPSAKSPVKWLSPVLIALGYLLFWQIAPRLPFGCLGVLLSRLLRSANMIPPVAAVLALVDIWTVLLGGPVQKAIESQTPASKAVVSAMTVPLPSAPKTGAAPFVVVGFADFLFAA